MIKSIQLRNFQSHEDTTLNLHAGVNSVVGSSNVGKSAVLRAIKWVLRNRPLGTGFIRQGSNGLCEVSITTDRGVVTRRRGEGENSYIINGEVFKALQGDVPTQVEDVINLSASNWGDQLDFNFGVLESGASFAGKINAATKLDIADELLSVLSSQIRASSRQANALGEKIKQSQDLLESEQFKLLDQLFPIIEVGKQKAEGLASSKRQFEELSAVVGSYKELLLSQAKLSAAVKISDELDLLLTSLETINSQQVVKKSSLASLTHIIQSVADTEKVFNSIASVLGEAALLEQILSALIVVVERQTTLQGTLISIQSVVTDFGTLRNRIVELDQAEKEALDKLAQTRSSITECPVCDGPIDATKVDKVMEWLVK